MASQNSGAYPIASRLSNRTEKSSTGLRFGYGNSFLMEAIRILTDGTQGWWYDPSDFSTLFQDAAGTTPVTAVEQPVGLMLDKSGQGNHATQATSTSRPILRNRYNQVLNSGFAGAVAGSPGTAPTNWSLFSSGGSTTVTSNGDGTNIIGFTASASQIFLTSTAFAAQANTKTYVTAEVVSNSGVSVAGILGVGASPPAGTTTSYQINGVSVLSSALPVSGDKVTLVLSTTSTAGNLTFRIGAGAAIASTGTVQVKNTSWLLASDASLPYQRVNTATDYGSDTSKFPLYLDADGSDDGMATAAFAAGSDKLTAFAAVRKAVDNAMGTVFELSADSTANAGGFGYFLNGAQPGIDAAVISGTTPAYTSVVKAAPASIVVALIGSISTDTAVLRYNGSQVSSASADQGTGNFGTYPLYLFRRGGTSFPFNGRFYGGAGKFRTLSAAEIATVEQYLRMKSRAY